MSSRTTPHGPSGRLGSALHRGRIWLFAMTLVVGVVAPMGAQTAVANDETDADTGWIVTAAGAEDTGSDEAEATGASAPTEDTEQSESTEPAEDTAPTEDTTPAEDPAPTEPADEEIGDNTEATPAPREFGTSDGLITPMAVPPATGNNAVITVSVRGDRTSLSNVAPLAGVTLQLYNRQNSGLIGTRVSDSWATCVSDSAGDCSFVVPNTQPWWQGGGGDNRDRRFFIVQEGAPTGWFMNPSIRTGSTSGWNQPEYRFETGDELRSGQTYRSTSHFMYATGNSNQRSSSGWWQNSRENPRLDCSPALRVALVLDLSGSVTPYASDLKDAAKGLVDGLAGSGSSLALFTFADTAPRNSNNSGQNYGLVALDEGNNLHTTKNRIDNYSTNGATNWDRGIYQVATSATHFDIAIVVTDGMPTVWGDSNGPGSSTRIVEMEHSIFSANALKQQGTRILAVGVGDGTSGNPSNLAAISGTNGYGPGVAAIDADYFQSSWTQLRDVLQDITRAALCRASVDVTKLAQSWGQTSPQPASGWPIGITATAPATFVPGGGTSFSAPTGASGTVSATLSFPSRTAGTTTLTISETLTAAQAADGWAMQSVSCTVNGVNRPVVPSGTSVQVTAGISDAVACTFVNVQTRTPDIDVVKRGWSTASAADVQVPGGETAPEVIAGGSIPVATVITWTYDVTNTGQTVLQNITVVDDQLAASAVSCPHTTLAPGATMRCTATAAVHP